MLGLGYHGSNQGEKQVYWLGVIGVRFSKSLSKNVNLDLH